MREAVRPLIQRQVAERLSLKLQGDGIGRAIDLPLKQPVDALKFPAIFAGAGPFAQ